MQLGVFAQQFLAMFGLIVPDGGADAGAQGERLLAEFVGQIQRALDTAQKNILFFQMGPPMLTPY